MAKFCVWELFGIQVPRSSHLLVVIKMQMLPELCKFCCLGLRAPQCYLRHSGNSSLLALFSIKDRQGNRKTRRGIVLFFYTALSLLCSYRLGHESTHRKSPAEFVKGQEMKYSQQVWKQITLERRDRKRGKVPLSLLANANCSVLRTA